MRDVYEIQDELEAVAAERYARWSRGETAADLDARLDALFEEKRIVQSGAASGAERDEIIRAAEVEKKMGWAREEHPPKPVSLKTPTARRVADAGERRRRVYEMFDAGARAGEIASEVGMSVGGVYSLKVAWKRERAAAA